VGVRYFGEVSSEKTLDENIKAMALPTARAHVETRQIDVINPIRMADVPPRIWRFFPGKNARTKRQADL